MRNPVPVVKLVVAIGSLIKKPEELDRVIKIVDLLEKLKTEKEFKAIVEDVKKHPQGREALSLRPSIGSLDLIQLKEKPETTLGGAYGRFMVARNLSQTSFPGFKIKTDMDWIISHFYETHDLWHVVTGFDTDTPGELGLQAFYLAQTRSYLPLFVLAALFINTAIYSYEEKDRRFQAIADGWNLGKKAKKLFGCDWHLYMDMPLDEVREQFGIFLKAA
ncbi:MAG: Coq4 family protein [Bdellovibrionota bacterium]